MSGADLTNANLMEADLSGADLSGANLSGASLGGADLSATNLDGVISSDIYGNPASMPEDYELVNGVIQRKNLAEETPSTSSINGQVSGALDASGLSVILESSSLLMESSLDALGQFSFEALSAGEYVVKLSGYGYDLGAAQNVALAEDESASLDLSLIHI